MTKIQILQIIALIPLLLYIFIAYSSDQVNQVIFTILALINLALWIWRQVERRNSRKNADSQEDIE